MFRATARLLLAALLPVFAGCAATSAVLDPDRAAATPGVGFDGPTRYGVYTSYEHFIRAGLCREAGDLEGALVEMEEALFSDPDDFLLRTAYAELLIEMGRYSRARVQLARALLMEPSAQPAWLGVAKLHLAEGNRELAVEAARQGARCEPGSHEADLWLARHFADAGELERAAELYEKVLDDEPDRLDALEGLADVLARKGEPGRAIELYTSYLEHGGRDVAAAMELAHLLTKEGRVARAVNLMEAAVRSHPERKDLREELIRLLMDAGLHDRAVAHVRSLPAPTPGDAEPIVHRAEILAAAGRPWEGRRFIVENLGRVPSDQEARLALARMEISTGRLEAAELLLEDPEGGWSEELAAGVRSSRRMLRGGTP